MEVLEAIERQILAMHAMGKKPRRVLIPNGKAADLHDALMQSHRGRIDDQPPLHILGIPYFFEGDCLVIESD